MSEFLTDYKCCDLCGRPAPRNGAEGWRELDAYGDKKLICPEDHVQEVGGLPINLRSLINGAIIYRDCTRMEHLRSIAAALRMRNIPVSPDGAYHLYLGPGDLKMLRDDIEFKRLDYGAPDHFGEPKPVTVVLGAAIHPAEDLPPFIPGVEVTAEWAMRDMSRRQAARKESSA